MIGENRVIFNWNWFSINSIAELSEEWALATSLKDLSENHCDADDETESETFSLKYLGNTVIESARSEEATAEAVKAIISTAKGSIWFYLPTLNSTNLSHYSQPPTENFSESI